MNASTATAASVTGAAGEVAHTAPAAGAPTTHIEMSRRARRAVGDRPVTVDVRVSLGCMARIEAQAQTGVPEAAEEYQLFDAQGTAVRVRAQFRTKSGPSHVHLLPRRLVIDAGRNGQLTAQAHYS